MKNLKTISKYLQIAVLLAFFLPFFPKGCEPKKAEEVLKPDSTMVDANNSNAKSSLAETTMNLPKDSTVIDTASIKQTSTTSNSIENDNSLSGSLSVKLPILKPLLRPSDNFSGIGSAIDVFQYFNAIGIAFALLLLTIGLIIKLKDYNPIFHLINSLAIFFLFFARSSFSLNNTRLWGYWVCLALLVGMAITDFVIMFIQRKRTS